MKALIMLLLFCLTLEYEQLSQYGSKVIHGSSYFYLSLAGFKSGDKVYIEVSYDSYYYFSHSIYYRQSNSYFDSEFSSNSFILMTSGTTSTSNNKHTKYYTIKLNGNYNYLLFKFSGDSTWFTIRHAKSSPTWIIIVCISALVAIVATAVIIYWCRRRSLPDYASRVDGPLVSPYPIVQPQPQPPIYTQPVYQPYVQSGYP
jgi:hypothetical protein